MLGGYYNWCIYTRPNGMVRPAPISASNGP
jgi:hypothetical protein